MTIAEFIMMGGYGKYVWSSFAITFAVLIANVVTTRLHRRRAAAEVAAVVRERGDHKR